AAPFQAQLAQAKARFLQAEAQRRFAAEEVKRAQALPNLTAAERDLMQARLQVAAADCEVARAAVDIARHLLAFTRVAAPADGKARRVYVKAGDLVSVAEARPLLATLSPLNAIGARFDMDERSYLDYQKRRAQIVVGCGEPLLGALARDKGFPLQ